MAQRATGTSYSEVVLQLMIQAMSERTGVDLPETDVGGMLVLAELYTTGDRETLGADLASQMDAMTSHWGQIIDDHMKRRGLS